MRSAAMLVAVAAAYVLLRGHPEPWPGVVRACLAVLALVAGLGLWGRRGSGRGASLESRRPVSWLDYGAIGLAVLACECGFLVFLSAAPKPLESVALRFEEWLRPAVALERRQQRPAGEARPGNWLFQGDKKFRRLPMRTDLRQGNRPEIFLQPASEADVRTLLDSRVYVQAFALSQYGDGTWSAFPGGAEGLEADKDGWLRFAGRGGPVVACRVFQGLESSGQNPLVGLQGMVAARVPEVTRFDDGLALLPEGMARFGGFRYDTLSSPLSLDELDAGAVAAGVAEPEVPAEWLALPGGPLGRELAALAELASGEGPVVERLRGIRNHLRTTHEYSLTTENPEGRDPLENFLLHEQKGHCEHFATAGALMARACGVPSRIAYGWVGGTYYESSRTFVFRAREAHAWAEVWIRGRGWVVLDPTPAATPRWTQPEVAPPDAPAPGAGDPSVAEAPAAGERPVWRAALGLTLVFALPGLGLLGLRALRGSRRVASGAGGVGGADAGYLRAFRGGCRRRGVGLVPGTTLRSALRRLDESPEFAAELVRYHYGVRYEGRAPDEGVERELRERIDRWVAASD